MSTQQVTWGLGLGPLSKCWPHRLWLQTSRGLAKVSLFKQTFSREHLMQLAWSYSVWNVPETQNPGDMKQGPLSPMSDSSS